APPSVVTSNSYTPVRACAASLANETGETERMVAPLDCWNGSNRWRAAAVSQVPPHVFTYRVSAAWARRPTHGAARAAPAARPLRRLRRPALKEETEFVIATPS